MNVLSNHPAHAARRTVGFTLVELMVTIAIIAILAGIALGALNGARTAARKRNTQALIAKLHHVVMTRYESYQTRRLPISTSGMAPAQAAQTRLDVLRDLMRMEMPERWNDVTANPVAALLSRPALSQLYFQQGTQCLARLQAAPPAGQGLTPQEAADLMGRFGPAECLYMIINTGDPDEFALFNQNDFGDADGDGLLEFHDGWDRPIMFLRWAPGFPGASGELRPLIYSGGADREFGIDLNESYTYAGDPYASGAGASDGTNEHVDNIHNHHIEAR